MINRIQWGGMAPNIGELRTPVIVSRDPDLHCLMGPRAGESRDRDNQIYVSDLEMMPFVEIYQSKCF